MDDVQQLYETIGDLKRRIGSMVRHGTVHDTKTGMVQIDWGPASQSGGQGGSGGSGGGSSSGGDQGGGDPLLSPWIRTAQHNGVVTENVPYKKGQTVTSIATDPDHLTALVFPHSWSDNNPQDKDASTDAHTYRIRKADDAGGSQGQSGGSGGGSSSSGTSKAKDDDEDFTVKRTYNGYEIKVGKSMSHVLDRKAKTITITNKNVKHTIGEDSHSTEVGGVKHTISKDGVAITGGKLTHNGKQFGSDHRHEGVQPGGGNTGTPIA